MMKGPATINVRNATKILLGFNVLNSEDNQWKTWKATCKLMFMEISTF